MPSLLALERYLPPHRYHQREVTRWVREWLLSPSETSDGPGDGVGAGIGPGDSDGSDGAGARTPAAGERLLSVYESAGVATRASVVPIEEVFHPRDFAAQNRRYREIACAAGTDVAGRALAASGLAASEIGLVVSVSCTGFMIPAVDAHVAEALGLGPRLARLPITESGCAGGVVGLARAADYLTAYPDRAALVLALEFASLTFQRGDRSATNVVSTAIFGDGGAAAVLVGPRHPRAAEGRLRLRERDSVFFPGTAHLMGFELTNSGLQIVLDRGIAPFVRRTIVPTVEQFLCAHGLSRDEIAHFVLHPGGRRVIEVMAERLGLGPHELAATEAVLSEHGNMSSVTVLFVLDEVLRRGRPRPGALGLLGAFGPGFGAELLLVEFA